MVRRFVLTAFIAASLMLAGFGETQDKKKTDAPPNPQGEPKGFHEGESARYAIWHGKNAWHVRTTTAKVEHHFKGIILVEGGVIEKAHGHDLEKEGKLRDHWRLNVDHNRIDFDFRTNKGLDGIDFVVSPTAKRIRFNLHINGRHQADQIFVGHADQHPATDPFHLPAHPHKK